MNLDREQLQAVEATQGPVIIMAGPGSGKTRVLVSRILRLIENGAQPEEILALTFTNKAADEMRKRLEGRAPSLPYISTFHSLAYDILSKHGFRVGVEDVQASFDNGLLDFDALLFHLKQLFQEHADILEQYRERFHFISVDEYQDTNPIQGDILRLLGSGHGNVCVIGDPNQAIYGFRGATLKNFFSFETHFPNPTKISLSKNYRSHPSIQNASRLLFGKDAGATGPEVSIHSLPSNKDEISYVLREVKRLIGGQDMQETDAGLSGMYHAGDIAILYRVRAIGKEFARAFSRAGIPHQLVGEENFFEHPEIRETLKYLQARDSSQHPADAIHEIVRNEGLRKKYDDGTPLGIQKYENILQLQTMAAVYNSIELFLRYALLSRAEDAPLRNDVVILMTAHASKGLEFPVVFVVGVEEGLFPYERAKDIKEERRLLYVAMTRAKERLYITHARRRMLFGKTSDRTPSRFLDAIPEDVISRAVVEKNSLKKPFQKSLL